MALTDIEIRNLKAGSGQRLEVWDDKVPGLGVRISSTGTKSFVLLYRHKGRAQRLTLGRFPVISLKEARVLAQDALHKITHGLSPKPVPEAAVVAEEVPRFKQTAADFLQLHCYRKNRQKTATEIERLLQTHFLPKWAARDVRGITKHETLKIIDALVLS